MLAAHRALCNERKPVSNGRRWRRLHDFWAEPQSGAAMAARRAIDPLGFHVSVLEVIILDAHRGLLGLRARTALPGEKEQSERQHTQEPQSKMKEWRTPRKKRKWRRNIMSGRQRRTNRRSRACTSDERIRAVYEADEVDEHEKRTTRDIINATASVRDEAPPPKLGGGHGAW